MKTFRKCWPSALLAIALLLVAAASAVAQVPIYTRPLNVSGNATIISGTISGVTFTTSTGVAQKVGIVRVPMVSAPTGTMANNGAVTLGTALDVTYPDCYLFYPAGAIAAAGPGSAAGWYYTQMSSTTVGTSFNNVYTTGDPTVPASPTAFATTGPGAFTGDTSEEQVVATLPILNAGAHITATYQIKNNNSAGAKTYRVRLNGAAGSILTAVAQTTVIDTLFITDSYNVKQTYQRVATQSMSSAPATGLTAPGTVAVDMSVATDIRSTIQKAVATDWVILEFGETRYLQ